MTARVLMTVMLVTLAALLLPGPTSAEGPVTVEAVLNQTTFRLGDPIELRLVISYQRGVTIDSLDPAGKLGGLELLQLKERTAGWQLDGTQTLTLVYSVSGYIPGQYQLPPISVSFSMADGQPGTAATSGGVVVEVQSVLGNGNEPFRDIKPPLPIEREPVAWSRNAAAAALVLAVSLLLVLAGRRLLRRRFVPAAAITLNAEDEAGAQLARLGAMALTTPEEFQEYYGGVSRCVRRYLDRRYELSAATSTSREVRVAMESRGLHPWQARIISDLLDECDAARWAHYQPDIPRARRAVTIAFEIVDLAGGGRAELSEPVGGGTARKDAF
ncbi:MAG: hypothetical protein EXR51_01200 [Dehalococcoidia bacterium]|nr:hypothetical protein [Dehalococcoidia bacterium]